jgi:hypothetical protein
MWGGSGLSPVRASESGTGSFGLSHIEGHVILLALLLVGMAAWHFVVSLEAAILGFDGVRARVHACHVVEGWDYGWTLVSQKRRELHQVAA